MNLTLTKNAIKVFKVICLLEVRIYRKIKEILTL